MWFVPNPLAAKIAEIETKPQVSEAAQAVLNYARDHVPVDTGELRDSLELLDEGDGYRVQVGTDHWIFPEFGTSDMPAEPYLRPAIDDVGLHR